MFLKNRLKNPFVLIGGLVFVAVLGVLLLMYLNNAPAQTSAVSLGTPEIFETNATPTPSVTVPIGTPETFDTDEIIVQGYQLVNETHISPTVSDLTYKVTVRNTGGDKIGVSGKGESLSTAVTFPSSNSVNFGDIPAGGVATSSDTFTIRQDRMESFTTDQLDWQFATALEVGEIEFLEPGGRLGHGGLFKIQASNPPVGEKIELFTNIFGKPNLAHYRFLKITGEQISAASLENQTLGSTAFVASVTIPSEPFIIEISGTNVLGVPFRWTSSTYQPAPVDLRLELAHAILTKGESIEIKIRARFLSASGPYTLRLLLPPGFSGESGPWIINPNLDESPEILSTIQSPLTGGAMEDYRIEVEAVPSDVSLPSLKSGANLEVTE